MKQDRERNTSCNICISFSGLILGRGAFESSFSNKDDECFRCIDLDYTIEFQGMQINRLCVSMSLKMCFDSTHANIY